MNRIFVVSGIILICSLLVTSCNKTTQECYSCDRRIDAIIKQKKSEFQTMSLETLATFDDETVKAAFRMYDASKKTQVWREKYRIILSDTSRYTEAERSAINLLYVLLEKNIYIDTLESVRNDVQEFIDDWVLNTKEKFGWDDIRYQFLLLSLDTDEGKFRMKSISNKTVNNQKLQLEDCNCHKKSGVFIPDCPTGFTCNENLDCQLTIAGCGYLFLSRCNGFCVIQEYKVDKS